MNQPKRFNHQTLILVLILSVAFGIRFAGIFHDLPFVYNPDELHLLNRTMSFGSGDLNPHWFHKPAFFLYLLFVEFGVYFVIGKLIGLFHSVHDFAMLYFMSKSTFLLIGRGTVVLFSVATVYLTYLVGRENLGRKTGLLAALLLTLTMGHISSSQVVKADIPAAFFTLLSFFFIARIAAGEGRVRDYVGGAAFAALGTATKYYSILLLPVIVLAHFLRSSKKAGSTGKRVAHYPLAITLVCFCLTFFLASPFNLLDPAGLERIIIRPLHGLMDLGHQYAGESLDLSGDGGGRFTFIRSSYQYILLFISPAAMGTIGLLSLASMLVGWGRSNRFLILLLSFPLIYTGVCNLLKPFYLEVRHLSVIYPFMALWGAHGLESLFRQAGKRRKDTWSLAGLLLVFLSVPVYQIIGFSTAMFRPDSLTVAKEWIVANIPAGTKIITDSGMLPISPSRKNIREKAGKVGRVGGDQYTSHYDEYLRFRLAALPTITYDLFRINFPYWQGEEQQPGVYLPTSARDKDYIHPFKPLGVWPYDYYRKNGYRYAVIVRDVRIRNNVFLPDEEKLRKFPSFYTFYHSLLNKALLVKTFDPADGRMRGMKIRIFKIR